MKNIIKKNTDGKKYIFKQEELINLLENNYFGWEFIFDLLKLNSIEIMNLSKINSTNNNNNSDKEEFNNKIDNTKNSNIIKNNYFSFLIETVNTNNYSNYNCIQSSNNDTIKSVSKNNDKRSMLKINRNNNNNNTTTTNCYHIIDNNSYKKFCKYKYTSKVKSPYAVVLKINFFNLDDVNKLNLIKSIINTITKKTNIYNEMYLQHIYYIERNLIKYYDEIMKDKLSLNKVGKYEKIIKSKYKQFCNNKYNYNLLNKKQNKLKINAININKNEFEYILNNSKYKCSNTEEPKAVTTSLFNVNDFIKNNSQKINKVKVNINYDNLKKSNINKQTSNIDDRHQSIYSTNVMNYKNTSVSSNCNTNNYYLNTNSSNNHYNNNLFTLENKISINTSKIKKRIDTAKTNITFRSSALSANKVYIKDKLSNNKVYNLSRPSIFSCYDNYDKDQSLKCINKIINQTKYKNMIDSSSIIIKNKPIKLNELNNSNAVNKNNLNNRIIDFFGVSKNVKYYKYNEYNNKKRVKSAINSYNNNVNFFKSSCMNSGDFNIPLVSIIEYQKKYFNK